MSREDVKAETRAGIRAALNAEPELALQVFLALKNESPTGRLPTLVEWFLRFESVRTGRLLCVKVPLLAQPEWDAIPTGISDVWGRCNLL
jgi:hypothetical protein